MLFAKCRISSRGRTVTTSGETQIVQRDRPQQQCGGRANDLQKFLQLPDHVCKAAAEWKQWVKVPELAHLPHFETFPVGDKTVVAGGLSTKMSQYSNIHSVLQHA